jgi:hypothetical protein
VLFVLVISCVSLWGWPARYPRPDIILGIDLVVMAALGGIVSAHATVKPIEKLLYGSAFVVLGALGVRLVVQQSSDVARAERQLRDTLTSIAEEATGGDSFCYVDIRQWYGFKTSLRASLLQRGRYPLSNVDIRIVQIDDLAKHLAAGSLSQIERYFSLPFVRRGSFLKPLADYPVRPDEESRAFNVFMVARNGVFSESVRLRRVNGSWSEAKIVDASYYSGALGVVLEETDKNFPKDTLALDNDWNGRRKLKRLTIKEKDND